MPNAAVKSYDQVRRNMVDCQLRTNNVESEDVLRAFESVPRERFLPDPLEGSAYVDEDLPLDGGRFMLEPLVQARLIQAGRPQEQDRVLNIGDATGYSSALLSRLAGEVVVPEAGLAQAVKARAVWESLGARNIRPVPGDVTRDKDGFDLIVINGSVKEIPAQLGALLRDGGRLVAVVRPAGTPMGTLILAEKGAGQNLAVRRLFDAASPYLAEFAPKPDFVF